MRAGDKAPVVCDTFMSRRMSDIEGDVVGSEPGEHSVPINSRSAARQSILSPPTMVRNSPSNAMRSRVLDLSLPKVAPFGQHAKEKRKGGAVVDDGQDEEVDRHPSRHPLGSVQSQGAGGIGQTSEREGSDARRLEMDVLEEALRASVVRVDPGSSWEGRGQLSQIDGFGLEQGDDEGRHGPPFKPEAGFERVESVVLLKRSMLRWRRTNTPV